MTTYKSDFANSFRIINEIEALYIHLKEQLNYPNDLSDLLRLEVVYALSALDKLVHDIVIEKSVNIVINRQVMPVKLKNFPFLLHNALAFAEPNEPANQSNIIDDSIKQIIRADIVRNSIKDKIKTESYQNPDKITEGLSMIWKEDHKWQLISKEIGIDENTCKTELKLIYTRRNSIVHEFDWDITNAQRKEILLSDVKLSCLHVKKIGDAIIKLTNSI